MMKERILNKSLELFSSRGFDAVSVSMISEGLGISKGALYKHYESKRAIFDAIIKRMEENDYVMSADFDLPTDIFSKMPARPRGLPPFPDVPPDSEVSTVFLPPAAVHRPVEVPVQCGRRLPWA